MGPDIEHRQLACLSHGKPHKKKQKQIQA